MFAPGKCASRNMAPSKSKQVQAQAGRETDKTAGRLVTDNAFLAYVQRRHRRFTHHARPPGWRAGSIYRSSLWGLKTTSRTSTTIFPSQHLSHVFTSLSLCVHSEPEAGGLSRADEPVLPAERWPPGAIHDGCGLRLDEPFLEAQASDLRVPGEQAPKGSLKNSNSSSKYVCLIFVRL